MKNTGIWPEGGNIFSFPHRIEIVDGCDVKKWKYDARSKRLDTMESK